MVGGWVSLEQAQPTAATSFTCPQPGSERVCVTVQRPAQAKPPTTFQGVKLERTLAVHAVTSPWSLPLAASSPPRLSVWVQSPGGLLQAWSCLRFRKHILSIQQVPEATVWLLALCPCFKPSGYPTFSTWPWPPPEPHFLPCSPPTNSSSHPVTWHELTAHQLLSPLCTQRAHTCP